MKKLFLLMGFLILCAVSPVFALTERYLDPDYAGGTKNGLAATPWSALDSSAWTSINSLLASDDVTVYFSAREASSDTRESYGGTLATGSNTRRTDTSTHLLTLDGMSKWNANDTTPSWENYTGTNKCQLGTSSTTYAYDEQSWGFPNRATPSLIEMNYFTLKGFYLISNHNGDTGSYTVAWFKGNHKTIRDCYIVGMFYQQYACGDHGWGDAGQSTYLYIIDNEIVDADSEAMYIGGCASGDNTIPDTCGMDHVTIEGNYIHSWASKVGEQDGIDIKCCNTNVTVKNNRIVDSPDVSIISMAKGPQIIEGNIIETCKDDWNALVLTTYWPANNEEGFGSSVAGNNPMGDVTIRNNVMFGSSNGGIYIEADNQNIGNVYFYNNSIYDPLSTGGGRNITSVTLKNNLVYGDSSISSTSSIIHSYNDFYGTVSGFTRGGTEYNTNPMFTSSTNLTLQTSSPFRNGTYWGTNLYSDGVTTDILETARPSSGNMTMGSYEYMAGTTPPTATGCTIQGGSFK